MDQQLENFEKLAENKIVVMRGVKIEKVGKLEHCRNDEEMRRQSIRGTPMQMRSRIVAREFKSDDRPHRYAGTPLLEALKAIISTA